MRVILAGLFVYVCIVWTGTWIASLSPDDRLPWWAIVAIVGVVPVAIVASLFIFNRNGFRPFLQHKSLEANVEALDRAGLIERQSFNAVRAFAVEEYEDEGPHYFVELDDARVLYLNGQYLYHYEPIDDNEEEHRPRSFPCTEFEVLRHRTAGYVVDLRCGGVVLEPESIVSWSSSIFDDESQIPDDGQIFEDRSYESLRRDGLGTPSARHDA